MFSVSKLLDYKKRKLTLKSRILQRLPIVRWLPKYTKIDLVSDFVAGLTVGLTMMPQSIAYANLAGLPAQYGLYTAFIGSFTYIMFGTIKQVSIGPTSLMALLTFSYTEDLPVDFVILLTLVVGCIELLMGIFKLGFFVDFISPCVTSGFTSAMSMSITISQLKNLFGLRNLKNHGFFDVMKQIFQRYHEIQFGDTLLGICCMLFLIGMKQLIKIRTKSRKLRKFLWFLSISKNALIVLITTVLAFILNEYGNNGCPFVLSGNVPSGLPTVKPPNFTTQIGNQTVNFIEMISILGTGIFVVPIAAVLANVAIAKAFTSGTVVDATQEMITLGLCNIFGSFVQAMPSCGAFTRSAVANSSGVRTPLQGLYSGLIIVLALSFLTPYFFYIPRATLAAVLITAIMTMFDYEIFPKLWKCNKFDFYLTVGTFIVGTLYGVDAGMIVGGLANLIILLKLWTRPGLIKEIRTNERGVKFIYIKPEIGLYYPAADYLSTNITEIAETSPNLSIVIDCTNIIRIDYAGCLLLKNLMKIYKNKLNFINVRDNVMEIIRRQSDLNDLSLEREKSKEIGVNIPLLDTNFCDKNNKLQDYNNV